MGEKTIIKHTIKDSVFSNLFKEPKYLIQLYYALHPEDVETTEEDIDNVTINNVMTDSIYNDLGFRVKDRLIILVEAQSTWSENIIIRAFMYLAQTYREYIESTHQNLYKSKKLKLPKPELYVIYTGDKEIKDEYISFKDSFFAGEDECALNIKVMVLTEGHKNDIVYQYIVFCKICNEQIAKHGRTQTAIDEIIRICSDENILKEYLEAHRTEVQTIMTDLFNQEEIFKSFVRSETYEARMEGKMEGRMEGREEGISSLLAKLRALGADENMLKQAQLQLV